MLTCTFRDAIDQALRLLEGHRRIRPHLPIDDATRCALDDLERHLTRAAQRTPGERVPASDAAAIQKLRAHLVTLARGCDRDTWEFAFAIWQLFDRPFPEMVQESV